ncbi:MAG: CBS domain-containing protein [Thermoproteota archaeon]|jgi:predicted transcriptional regulator|nr:CBS domain-containing protein [Thermoproteota archaeon]
MNLEAQTPELKVAEYMTPNPITVQSDITFTDAATKMAGKGIGNLIVVENERPVGILTEREILQYLSQWLRIPNRLLEYVRVQPFEAVKPDTTILDAAKTMISKKSRLLVFDNESNRLVGIITASDIVKAFRTTDINPPLEQVMTRKIFNLEYNNAIMKAVRMMHRRRIGSVLIVNNKNTKKSKTPYGIFTERDLLTKILSRGIDLDEKVGDYSSTPLITAQIGIRAIEAANIMYLNKMKRLLLTDPLSQDSNPVSIVTARDLVEAFQEN